MLTPLTRTDEARFWATFPQWVFPDDIWAKNVGIYIFDDWKGAISFEFSKNTCELCMAAAKDKRGFFTRRLFREIWELYVDRLGGYMLVTRQRPGDIVDQTRFGFREYHVGEDGTIFRYMTKDDHPPWRKNHG